jgi:hypothetical protein
MFDDHDGVSFIDEPMKDIDKASHVLLVKSDTGLFDQVKVFGAGAHLGEVDAAFDELGDEFEALRFATGESGARLTEGEVAEPGLGEEAEWFLELWVGFKKMGCGFNIHAQDFSDRLSVVEDFEGGRIIAFSVTGFAVDPCGGEKIHLKFDPPVAFALGALPFFVVEGEARGGIASDARFGKLCVKSADVVEQFNVGGRTGAGGFTNGRLIDLEDMFYLIEARCFEEGGRRIRAGSWSQTAANE